MSSSIQRVLIYGGCGGLGEVLVSHFRSAHWWVLSVDLKSSGEADANVVVDVSLDWEAQHALVEREVSILLKQDKLDAIVNVAGGWAGGSAHSVDLIKNADLMWRQSVWSSTIAAALAAKHLGPSACIVLPGAQPALHGTPNMIGYGMAKAAVHQLVQSLSCGRKSGLPSDDIVALAILPVMLDTPMNRRFMPNEDKSTWTPLSFVANLIVKWARNEDRPRSGTLVQILTNNHESRIVENKEI